MKIFILGEQPVYSEGLSALVRRIHPDAEISMETHSQGMFTAESIVADLVLIECADPVSPLNIQTLKRLAETGARIALFSEQDSPEAIRTAMDAGIHGFIPKNLSVNLALNALGLIQMGGRYVPESVLASPRGELAEMQKPFIPAAMEQLTPRQTEVLEEMKRGLSNQRIAAALGISLATVKLHVNAILRTLSVKNRTEAVIMALAWEKTRAKAPTN